jgi:polar amino acid transport system substrate-binding protein
MRFLCRGFGLWLGLSNTVFSDGRVVKVALGLALPPWVMPDGQSGIIIDMFNTCLSESEVTVEPVLVPYAGRIIEYQNGSVDAVVDMNPSMIKQNGLNGFFTGELYAYQNYGYALASSSIEISRLSDLTQYSLLSWQGAIVQLGGEYADMAKNHPGYSEIHDQKLQVKMLYRGRVQVIQMDAQIFEYYRTQLIQAGEIDSSLAFTRFPIFGKSLNGFLFRNKSDRDACISYLEKQKDKAAASVGQARAVGGPISLQR